MLGGVQSAAAGLAAPVLYKYGLGCFVYLGPFDGRK